MESAGGSHLNLILEHSRSITIFSQPLYAIKLLKNVNNIESIDSYELEEALRRISQLASLSLKLNQ